MTGKPRPPALSHVGVAVRDLDSAIRRFVLLLGAEPEIIKEVPEQRVRVAIFAHQEAGRIELLEATSDDSPIARFIARRGEGLHHVCIVVDNLDRKLSELRAAGVPLVDETPRIGAYGCRIAFVHPTGAGGVLLELEERRRDG